MTGLTYIRGVATIKLDRTRCNGCRMCMKVCPHPVFSSSNGVVEVLEPDSCMECGACVINCPEGALSVQPGVGCATAILKGWFTRSKPSCEC
jgi:NAD-dependent dihydropyrimidine dehydrogenase PreA subunit